VIQLPSTQNFKLKMLLSYLEHARPNHRQAAKWIVKEAMRTSLIDRYKTVLEPGSSSRIPENVTYSIYWEWIKKLRISEF